jgi:acetyltransferase-like isoleucine patch superfamily enzyme
VIKNQKISNTIHKGKNVVIKCNELKLGKNITISDNVKLFGNTIRIADNCKIGSNTTIKSKNIQIGSNTTIQSNCDIFSVNKFIIGDRSILCESQFVGREIIIGNDFFSSVPLGKKFFVGGGGALLPTSNLIIGDRCTVHDVLINIAKEVKIGNDVGISSEVSFYTHYFWNSIFKGHPNKFAPITISDGCIIGAKSLFLPGIKLGNSTIVGAGSVVTKTFSSNSTIAGNPAKLIRKFIPKQLSKKIQIELLKNTLLWYTEILKTKGYSIKKDDPSGLKYVINKNKKNSILCYSTKLQKTNDFIIIFSFQKIKTPENSILINLNDGYVNGIENELTDDLRDFLRKIGIRIFTKRKFRSIPVTLDFQIE